MGWLAVIPVALLLAACLYQPKKARRFGYIDSAPRGSDPLPKPEPRQRLTLWRCKYDRCTIEQQTEPGAWPFSPSAVHTLPRELQTDPKELIR
jgi:hypothetical protein